MAKLSKQVVDALTNDREEELDPVIEEISRPSVSSKEMRIRSLRDRGEVVGNDNGIRHHRKW